MNLWSLCRIHPIIQQMHQREVGGGLGVFFIAKETFNFTFFLLFIFLHKSTLKKVIKINNQEKLKNNVHNNTDKTNLNKY